MLVLLIASLSHLSPAPADTSREVTIVRRNAKVIEVLVEIEHQTGLKFFFSNNEVDTQRKISLNMKGVQLTKVLDTIFARTTITYKFSDGYIILINTKTLKASNSSNKDTPFVKDESPEAQANKESLYESLVFKASGKVTTDNGEPLPGVNIIEKGTTTGTTTDTDGKFSLNISQDNAIILFSFIGFGNQEIVVNGRAFIEIALIPDSKILSEVVVIGYGTQKRRDLTGAVSSVSDKEISQLPVTNAEQGMQGRLAGVTVTQSASPGGNISVRIRGIGTIGDNEPLFIIDGVQTTGGLNNINPGDIESIDVLKDASAAAIYGSRAANGVVIVTTKRGLKNTKTKVDFSVYTGVQERWKKVDVLNAKDYVRVITEAQKNANIQRAQLGSALLDPLPADFTVDNVRSVTDWQDQVFRTGIIQNYQLGISGGNDKTNFSFSGSFRNEQGIIINSAFKRYTFRTSVDHEVSSRIKLGTTLNVSFTDRKEIPDNDIWNGVLQSAITMPEMFNVKNANGNYVGPMGGNSSIYGNSQNPVGQAERSDAKNPSIRAIGNVYGELKLIDGLKFKTLFSTDLGSAMFKYYQPTFSEGSRPIMTAMLTEDTSNTLWWNWENTLNYSKTFNNHEVTALIGTSAQRYTSEYFSAGRRGFPVGDPVALRYLPYGSIATNSGGATASSLLSFFGRLTYNFNEKYLLTATVRRDGSSRFYNDKWGTFPSFSMGWRMSEENFLKGSELVSNLKLRASWGRVGNQSVNSDYPWVTSVGPSVGFNTVLGGSVQTGIAPIQRGNENLTWETTTMSNWGTDLGLFQDRLGFSVDYFIKDTKNMLLQIPLSLIAGQAAAPNINAGAVQNKGLELSAIYRKMEGKFTFQLSANASFISNKITDLANVKYIVVNNTLRGSDDISRTSVGHSIGSFYGYVTDGLFQNQSEIDTHATQEPGTRPGDIRFKDISGPKGVPDGIINALDRTVLGDGFPNETYGLNFNGKYRHIDISLFLQGVSGVQIFNALEYLTLNNQGGNKTKEILDYWSESNPNGSIPRLTWDDPNRNSRISDRYIHDGSYARVKNLQIGYNFNFGSLPKSISIQNMRVYISAQNLFTFTKYNGFDPEVGTAARGYRSDLNLGVDQGRYPQPRTFLAGINMTF